MSTCTQVNFTPIFANPHEYRDRGGYVLVRKKEGGDGAKKDKEKKSLAESRVRERERERERMLCHMGAEGKR